MIFSIISLLFPTLFLNGNLNTSIVALHGRNILIKGPVIANFKPVEKNTNNLRIKTDFQNYLYSIICENRATFKGNIPNIYKMKIVIFSVNHLNPMLINNRNKDPLKKTNIISDQGDFIWYQHDIYPYLYSLEKYNLSIQDALLEFNEKHYDFDHLVDLLDSHYSSNQPTCVYVHCLHGLSRSIVLIGGYLIKYRGYNVQQVIKYLNSNKISHLLCDKKHSYNFLSVYQMFLREKCAI